MRALLAVAVLLVAGTSALAETATARFGGIAIDYDPARWAVTTRDDAAISFACRGPDCRTIRTAGFGGSVSVRLADTTEPAPDDLDRLRDSGPLWNDDLRQGGATHEYGGVTFTGYRLFSRCRAYTPSMDRAIGTLGDRRYIFTSGFNAGCKGIAGVGQERFEELLEGVRAVKDGAR